MVYSGARTHAHQLKLYRAYLARGKRHPIVANPDRGFGSKHQVRPAARYKHGNLPNAIDAAFAVDLQWADLHKPNADERAKLKDLAASMGMLATVSSEWWHFEPDQHSPVTSLAGIGYKGKEVLQLQAALNTVADAGLTADGDYGPQTFIGVQQFQMSNQLPVTGDWVQRDQAKLAALLKPKSVPAKTGARKPQPSKEPARKGSRPNVEGIDSNPTEYQTFRHVRQRAIAARQELDTIRQMVDSAFDKVDEIAKLVHHEQND